MPDKIANKIIGGTLAAMFILFIIVLALSYFNYKLIPATWLFAAFVIGFLAYRAAWQSKISSSQQNENRQMPPSNV